MRGLSPGASAGTVSGWANQAKLVKVEQQTKLAEKQAMLFKHSNATLLPMIWSGQFSDYKLQCGAEIIDVHKMILAARSPCGIDDEEPPALRHHQH